MKLIDRLLHGRPDTDAGSKAVVSSLSDLRIVNEDIRDELRSGGRKQNRANITMIIIGLLTLIVTVIGVVVTRQVRDEVQGLAELSPQEVVDQLRVGMSIDDLSSFLEVEPTIDEIMDEDVGLEQGTNLRRVLYWIPDKRIWVMAIADSFSNARILGVTVEDNALGLRFPSANTGDYADVFVTGDTTLGHLAAGCVDGYDGLGAGVSFGYFSIGCNGYGVNGYDFNIVAVNFYGAASDSETGLCCAGRPGEQLAAGVLDDDVAAVTFNSFAWGDYQFLRTEGGGRDAFGSVVRQLQIGPWLGEVGDEIDEPSTTVSAHESAIGPQVPLSRAGIGPVHAGMTLREAESEADILLTHESLGPGGTCATVGVVNLDVWFVVSLTGRSDEQLSDGVIQSIHGSRHTEEGLAVGDPVDLVEQTYGEPTQSWSDPYDTDGRVVTYEDSGYGYAIKTDGASVTELVSGDAEWITALEGCA